MKRALALVLLAAVATAGLASVETAGAATKKLSTKKALRNTAKLARKIAISQSDNGAVAYFAFGCKRQSKTIVVCIGGIGYADDSACFQRVRNRLKGRKLSARRYGGIYCGQLPDDSGGGGGGGEQQTAICGIRQSVCI